MNEAALQKLRGALAGLQEILETAEQQERRELPHGARDDRFDPNLAELRQLVGRACALSQKINGQKRPQCLFLSTLPVPFLEAHYGGNRRLLDAGYAEQLHALREARFGDGDLHAEALRQAGWRADELFINCLPLQQRWAAEKGMGFDAVEVILRQVDEAKPEAVYCRDLHFLPAALLRELRRRGAVVAGETAAAEHGLDFAPYDIIFSASATAVDSLRGRSVKAYYQPDGQSVDLKMKNTAEVLERHLRLQRELSSVAPPELSRLSYGYMPIVETQITDADRDSWRDPNIPARQRALVNVELQNFYAGKPVKPFEVLSTLLCGRVNDGDALLEVGCSSGYYMEILEYALKLQLAYHGIDISEAMIAMARNYYPRGRFECGSGRQLPYPDRSMHGVVSGCVLLHDPDYRSQIRDTCRVAKAWVAAHRTPVCKQRPTSYYKKYAYDVQTVEIRFNESELVTEFLAQGCELADKIEYRADPAADEYDVSYLFTLQR